MSFRLYLNSILLLSLHAFAGPEELIAEALQKFQNTPILKANSILVSFKLWDRPMSAELTNKVLSIALKDPLNTEIGHIDINLDASAGVKSTGEQSLRWVSQNFKQGKITEKHMIEVTNNVKDYISKIGPNNFAYLSIVSINEKHQGMGLSYPLICTTLGIVKNILNRDFIQLLDSSKKPNFYEKIGFNAIIPGELSLDVKFAAISDVLATDRCQKVFAAGI